MLSIGMGLHFGLHARIIGSPMIQVAKTSVSLFVATTSHDLVHFGSAGAKNRVSSDFDSKRYVRGYSNAS